MFLFSCKQEDEFNLGTGLLEDKLEIVDNRLKFSSSDFLNRKIEELKALSDEQLSQELRTIQQNEVYSLRPIINEFNVEDIAQRYKESSSLRQIEQESAFEFIGDDHFAALLNEAGEIQVKDSIYKYTPYGLYIAHETKYLELVKYMASGLNAPPTLDPGVPIACSKIGELSALSNGKLVSLTNNIQFIVPVPIEDPCNPGGGGGNPNPKPKPKPQPSIDLAQEYIDDMEPCNTTSGWANFAFGQSKLCFSKYTDKSQVRTKFWNQNYGLTRSVGLKVKHQYKFWGVWYDANIDELRLGINSMYYQYKMHPTEYRTNFVQPLIPTISFIYNGIWTNTPDGKNFYMAGNADDLPPDFDIAIVYALPKGLNEQTKESYIEATIWPEVKKALESFMNHNNLKYADLKGIQLQVMGDTKIGYRLTNIYDREGNSQKVEFKFPSDIYFEISFGLKQIGINQKEYAYVKLKPKNKFFSASINAYGLGRRGPSDYRGSLMIATDLDPR